MRVKICGITNLKDALDAVEAGADALGFVFYNQSPRYITPTKAKKIIDKLPPFVERVGLFVNEGVETIDTVCRYCDISRAQIHFDVDEESLDAIGLQTLPVVRAKSAEDISKFKNRYRLVDAFSDTYGVQVNGSIWSGLRGLTAPKLSLQEGYLLRMFLKLRRWGFMVWM